MDKYIDAEKLKAEIQKRIEETKSMKPSFDQFWAGQISAFKGTIKITESLQQEQPDVEINLGNEVKNFCLEYDARKDAWYNMTPQDQKLLSNPTWLNFATNIARHFYELGLNARKV